MDTSLNGRRALVCGSTQGIGLACAIELASLGARVTLMARNRDALRRIASDLPAAPGPHDFIAADFADPASVRGAIGAKLGEPAAYEILVNNTGGPPGGPAIDADPAAYLAAFNAHVICNQVLAMSLVPGMKKAGYGRIINIISTSVKAPIPGLGVSNTIRGAVANWAKTLSVELGPFGITVNNVLPGFTETERLRSLIAKRAEAAKKTPEQVATEMRATIPLGRFGTPDEIAGAVAFLASPAGAYISGINVPVDGGRTPSL